MSETTNVNAFHIGRLARVLQLLFSITALGLSGQVCFRRIYPLPALLQSISIKIPAALVIPSTVLSFVTTIWGLVLLKSVKDSEDEHHRSTLPLKLKYLLCLDILISSMYVAVAATAGVFMTQMGIWGTIGDVTDEWNSFFAMAVILAVAFVVSAGTELYLIGSFRRRVVEPGTMKMNTLDKDGKSM